MNTFQRRILYLYACLIGVMVVLSTYDLYRDEAESLQRLGFDAERQAEVEDFVSSDLSRQVLSRMGELFIQRQCRPTYDPDCGDLIGCGCTMLSS